MDTRSRWETFRSGSRACEQGGTMKGTRETAGLELENGFELNGFSLAKLDGSSVTTPRVRSVHRDDPKGRVLPRRPDPSRVLHAT